VTPLYPQKLALTSPTGGGRSVGIVSSRTKATEFFFRDRYPEVSVGNYHYSLRDKPEECSYRVLHGVSLKLQL